MDIDIKEFAKAVAEGFDLSNFKGDVVGVKVVENEIGNVEAGGIGIQIINNRDTPLTKSDEEMASVIKELQEAKDENGKYIMYDYDQWYAIFVVLSSLCGYPKKPKEFERTMKNIGSDEFRIPCKYENFRKVNLPQLPNNVTLWRQNINRANDYSLKQITVALKLMDLLNLG